VKKKVGRQGDIVNKRQVFKKGRILWQISIVKWYERSRKVIGTVLIGVAGCQGGRML